MEVMRLDEMTEEIVDRLFDEGCLVHPYIAPFDGDYNKGEKLVYIIHPFAYDIVED